MSRRVSLGLKKGQNLMQKAAAAYRAGKYPTMKDALRGVSRVGVRRRRNPTLLEEAMVSNPRRAVRRSVSVIPVDDHPDLFNVDVPYPSNAAARKAAAKYGSLARWDVAGSVLSTSLPVGRDAAMGIADTISMEEEIVVRVHKAVRKPGRRNPNDDVLFPYAERFSSETFPSLTYPDYDKMQVLARGATARAPSQVDGNLVFDAFFGEDIFGNFLTNPRKRGGRLVKGIVVSEMAGGYHVAVVLRSIRDAAYVEDDLQQAFPEGNWMREDNEVLTAFGVSVGKAKALAKQVAEMLGFPVGQVRVLSVRTKMRRNPAKKPAAKSSSKRKSPAGQRASAASRATSKAAHLGKATAEVMHEDGAYEILTARGNKFSWEEMQRVVGGNIERVPLKGGRIMVVNEEGMMRRMDINPGASLMVGTAIFGPAVVLARSAME